MSKLKILFTTVDRLDLVCVNALTHFENAVGKIATCKWSKNHVIGKTETPHEVAMRVMPDADWVFHAGMHYSPPPPNKRNYKIGLFTPDIHRSIGLKMKPRELIKRLNKAKFDAHFMAYIKVACEAFPIKPIDPDIYIKNLNAPIFHLAPCVNPSVFKPNNKPKLYDVAFLAHAHHNTHPFRYKIKTRLPELARENNWKTIIRGRPPGKTTQRKMSELIKQGYVVGNKYVETLARSKAFIFGLGRFKYPALKFVEGWGAGTCVFSDPPLGYEDLHFIPDWNFVNINPKNWEHKLKYYLRHPGERVEIARNGHNTFLKHHTCDVRAQQFIKFLEEHT